MRIIEAREGHAQFIGMHMRGMDRREIDALGFASPEDAVRKCIVASSMSFVAINEDEQPIAAWGYREDDMILADSAELWCLTTGFVARSPRSIMHYSRSFVRYVQRRHSNLVALVSCEYEASVRWCEWLGFEPAQIIQAGGLPFYVMRKTRNQ